MGYGLWQKLSYGNILKGILWVMPKIELLQLVQKEFYELRQKLSYGSLLKRVL